MPDMNFNCCESLNISSINFNCGSNRSEALEFNLINQEDKKYKFDNLLPESNNYLYIKILKNEKIVSLGGDLCKVFGIKKKDFIDKHLYEIKSMKSFFLDFIKPLFEFSVERGESFQFMFTNNKTEEELVCSLYPCCIPGDHITSVDIVVRQPQNSILDTQKFIINNI